jgi:hypothetical protein
MIRRASAMRRPRLDQRSQPAHWFTATSPAERRLADLFLADLLGHRPVPPVRKTPALWPPALLDQPLIEEGGPSALTICGRDVPVTDRMALLVTKNAPLPVTCNELMRTVKASGARDDYKSVAAIVPSPKAVDTRLLIFFHGNYGYVTIAPTGDVPTKTDPSGHSRLPRWLDKRKLQASKFKAAPIEFEFERLADAQRGIPANPSFKGLVIKDPVVLVPEDAELNANEKALVHWSIPPQCQYGVEGDGTVAGPGTSKLGELVIECYDHLRCLTRPSGATYLAQGAGRPGSWLGNNISRVYLSAHSGGGKPLLEAAGADMVMVTPTSLAGKAGRAVDLWLLDATYAYGIENYVNFCTNWNNAGLLGHAPDKTRVVCIYRGGTDTEATADQLRAELASKVLKVTKESLLKVHTKADMADPSMASDIIPALVSMPVVFIRTTVKHMDIPRLFMPLLLLTAAS